MNIENIYRMISEFNKKTNGRIWANRVYLNQDDYMSIRNGPETFVHLNLPNIDGDLKLCGMKISIIQQNGTSHLAYDPFLDN